MGSNPHETQSSILLQGTLDTLILKSLLAGEMHGLGVSRRIQQLTGGTFSVKPGNADFCVAADGYFQVLGIPLIRGRIAWARPVAKIRTPSDIRLSLEIWMATCVYGRLSGLWETLTNMVWMCHRVRPFT